MSSLNAVLPHLEQRFDSQRLVFWHDADGEYAAELDALDLRGVTTVRVENNEYAVKNRVRCCQDLRLRRKRGSSY